MRWRAAAVHVAVRVRFHHRRDPRGAPPRQPQPSEHGLQLAHVRPSLHRRHGSLTSFIRGRADHEVTQVRAASAPRRLSGGAGADSRGKIQRYYQTHNYTQL